MFQRNVSKALKMAAPVLGLLVAVMPLQAQVVPIVPGTANVHGHVTNPAGQPFSGGEVKLTKDKTTEYKDERFQFTFPIDANGDYKGTGVTPGDYFIYVIQDGKAIDRFEISFKAGDDKTQDFDMTRADYVKSMSDEQKKALEEYKKKNAETVNANKVINQLNATLKTVRADLAAAAPNKGDVTADVNSMKQAVDAKGDLGLLWITYGDALLAQGDHLAAADKAAGKPAMSDDDVLKMYGDAADAYKKGAELDSAGSKPNLADAAIGYNQMGTSLAREGKTAEATAAFELAVKDDPTKAGMYYKNEAVVDFNSNQNDAAEVAADKAITANPTDPLPYWIKGQTLIAKSTFDQKTQKLTPPPGCVDAYQKFLQLAPDDPKAPAVKEVLASLGEKIDTTFKAGKKK